MDSTPVRSDDLATAPGDSTVARPSSYGSVRGRRKWPTPRPRFPLFGTRTCRATVLANDDGIRPAATRCGVAGATRSWTLRRAARRIGGLEATPRPTARMLWRC
jgi:hypothetical protein